MGGLAVLNETRNKISIKPKIKQVETDKVSFGFQQ